jgi:hypothetical protein
MGISIYKSCYNILTNGFSGWEENLKNACRFADELIIVVNNSDDDTDSAIRDTLWEHKNWKVVPANFSKLDPLFDGRLKNLGLQSASHEWKLQLDLDEDIGLWQRPLWENAFMQLKFSGAKALAVPSVDIYKTLDGYKSINYKTYGSIGQLWRGPALNALKHGYFINTQFSDGTELIDENFQCASAILSGPKELSDLESGDYPFVVHYGYLSQEERIKRTEKFWGAHWLQESNGTLPAHKLHTDESTFKDYEYKPHNLRLS